MNNFKHIRGQALVETALVLVLLLVIFLGISEFARAWYVKNSLKNAVRAGARVSAVTPTPFLNLSFMCTSAIIDSCSTTPPGDPIERAVCCQPGMPKATGGATTSISLECRDTTNTVVPCSTVASGYAVKVSANYMNPQFFVIGGYRFTFMGIPVWPWSQSITITSDASMMYE